MTTFSAEEESQFSSLVTRFKNLGLLSGNNDEQYLREVALNRHLVNKYLIYRT